MSVFAFLCKIVGVEPTAYSLKGNRSTNELYQPTAMCWLCCWILFWNTQYNTPRTFGLADYSVVFCDLCCPAGFPTAPLTTQTALLPLTATSRTITLPFPIPINWTGLVVKSAPPVTFHWLKFPLMQSQACRPTFFPQHPASLLPPPVLSVKGLSRVWAGLHSWTIAGAGV